MLAALDIRDIVLIDRLDLTLADGLGVLTGETGAGKSILLDALGLALGARADAGLLRHGAAQGSVAAVFDLPAGHPARAVLAEQGLAEDDELVLRRVLSPDGKSRAFVNDQPVSVALLKRLGALLVEMHGQAAEQGLLDAAVHRELLDAFGGLGESVAAVAAAFARMRDTATAAERAAAEAARAQGDADYLRHMAQELATLDPKPGEEAELAEMRSLLQAGEKLAGALGEATAALEENGGVESRLRLALRALERVADRAAGRFDAALAALDRALTEAGEAGLQLAAAGRALDLDPARLERAEERLFALRAVARKHNVAVDDLAASRSDFEQRLAAIEDGGAALAKLRQAAEAARADYRTAAAGLRAARQRSAAKLDKAVAKELPPLKLGNARFATRLVELTENEWSAAGTERVMFEVATNPGLPPGPLSKIASGGELSRFMLALRVVLAGQGAATTLIFDEVDRGIGGATADAVGERLARLAARVQVLVVTHSPQVAARGTHHWRIAKGERRNGKAVTTVTQVEKLDEAARREEIARMLAGARITDEARAAAESLMQGNAG